MTPTANPRRRSQHDWFVYVVIAVLAFAGLWVSERAAEARAGSRVATGAEIDCALGSEHPWTVVARRVPGGDPRRVLAAASTPMDLAPSRPRGAVGARTSLRDCIVRLPMIAVGLLP